MSKPVDVVRDNSNWMIRIRKENESAKQFDEDFGYLAEEKPEKRTEKPHERATVKYHHLGQYTLRQKKIHLEGKAALAYNEQEALMRSLASQVGARPSTALESTLFSHQRQMRGIEGSPAGFSCSNSAYGARCSLEQFGISEYGVKETRTKLPPH